LIIPELLITKDINPEEVEGFSNGLVDLADKLDDGCRRLYPWRSFDLKIRFFRKAPAKGSDLEIGPSRDMVYGRVEGFDGSMDGHLDADKDTDSEGNPHHREECPHLIQTKVSEGNLFEKVIKGHECVLYITTY
jgi:hypothetical protein